MKTDKESRVGGWLVQPSAGNHHWLLYSEHDPTGRTIATFHDEDTANRAAECLKQRNRGKQRN